MAERMWYMRKMYDVVSCVCVSFYCLPHFFSASVHLYHSRPIVLICYYSSIGYCSKAFDHINNIIAGPTAYTIDTIDDIVMASLFARSQNIYIDNVLCALTGWWLAHTLRVAVWESKSIRRHVYTLWSLLPLPMNNTFKNSHTLHRNKSYRVSNWSWFMVATVCPAANVNSISFHCVESEIYIYRERVSLVPMTFQ